MAGTPQEDMAMNAPVFLSFEVFLAQNRTRSPRPRNIIRL